MVTFILFIFLYIIPILLVWVVQYQSINWYKKITIKDLFMCFCGMIPVLNIIMAVSYGLDGSLSFIGDIVIYKSPNSSSK